MAYHYSKLNPEKALIWRIVHRANLSWILQNGLHCANSASQDPNFVAIGNPDLISRRKEREVDIAPLGTLADYVPFYFTPFSLMMYNIHTGIGGVPKRANEDICILVSSIPKIEQMDLKYVFTDRHALLKSVRYFNETRYLSEIDWPALQSRNFQRDPNDPERTERYQAEALIYRHVPIQALIGVVCYTELIKMTIMQQAAELNLNLNIQAMSGWYF